MAIASIPQDFNFEQISRAIMGKEAYGYQFKHSEIRIKHTRSGQTVYNAASFDDYDRGEYPSDCSLLSANTPAPDGYAEEWRGQMMIENQVRDTVLYRRA